MVESGIGRLLYVDKKSLYLTPFEESVKGSCFYIEQSSEFSETEKEQLIKLRSKVLAVSSGDMRVLNRRIQIIEQLCGLLGCLGVGLWSFGISVWLLGLLRSRGQLVVGFKCLCHCFCSLPYRYCT